jgi:asparagine synthase (glutamine-hydrolysing)
VGALVAAISKNKENVTQTVIEMLSELKHRGTDGHGLATPTKVIHAKTLNKLEPQFVSDVILGHNLSQIQPRDQLQPIKSKGFTLVFEGRLFPAPTRPGVSEPIEIASKIEQTPLEKAYNVIEKMSGSYVFALAEPDRIVAGRDVFGATPLYYAENLSLCALASERKALWKIGLQTVKPFPPGQIAKITRDGFTFIPVKVLYPLPKSVMDIETAAKALEFLLLDSIRKQVSDLQQVSVGFSGGIDSSVIAVLAKKVGLDVQLITVGLDNQPEVKFAKEAANALEMPLHIQTYTNSELEKTLQKVLWLTEENNITSACISIPFYWLAETASKHGHHVMLIGQGADELFGGYQRYLKEYKKMGEKAVEKAMFYDVVNAYNSNFQRDNQIFSYHNVELRLPYIDFLVVDFALRLHLKFKMSSTDDLLRKKILRYVAHKLNVPSLIADKSKKAIQYTTGVTKELKRLAKNDGVSLSEYIDKVYSSFYNANIR